MRRRNLLGLAALLGVAAIFFASLMCPPPPERPQEEDPRGDRSADPARAAAAAEDGERLPVAPDAQSDAVLVRVTDLEGKPLLGAEIFLHWADKPAGSVAKQGFSDARGEWSLERLPQARYRALAVADGFFPSAEPAEFEVPAAQPQVVVLPLERGARIDGFVFGLDGAEVPHAWLRFRNLDDGATLLRQADVRGAFSSGPLGRGGWEVAWVEHSAAEPDPRVRWSTVLEPGARAEVIVTLDQVRPGLEPRAGRAVGIVPSGR